MDHIYNPIRETLPCNIMKIWPLIRKGYRTTTTIAKILKKKPSDVTKMLQNMKNDGFLELKLDKHNIPNYDVMEQTLRLQNHDVYCFECHIPGDLENCKGCHRSFHITCKRSDPKKPLIPLKKPVPKIIQQVYDRLYSPAMGLPCANTSHNESTVNELSLDDSSRNVSSLNRSFSSESSLYEISLNESINETASNIETTSNNENIDEVNAINLKCENDGTENENENDVTFMGVIREPYRYKVSQFKFGPIENNDYYNNLCTVCKLLTTAEISNPVGIDQEKINQLLKNVYVNYASWLPSDTFNENKSSMIPSKDINLFEKILFCKVMTRSIMEDKFETNQYGSIIEFFCDSLDMQHCIGVLKGVDTEHYEASKYFVLDVLHDIAEIQTCLDCYINSSKKKPQTNWFTLPCKPLHELVLAKVAGFPDWPAKVINQRNNAYDVRFFGGKNERATINEKFIKPIDFTLHIKNNTKHNKAMAQLLEYRSLNEPRTYGETNVQVNNTLNSRQLIDIPTTPMEILSHSTPKPKTGTKVDDGKKVDNSNRIQEKINDLPNHSTPKKPKTGTKIDDRIQVQEKIYDLPKHSTPNKPKTGTKIDDRIQVQEKINDLPKHSTANKQKTGTKIDDGKQVDNRIQIQENNNDLPIISMETLSTAALQARKQKTGSKVDDGKQIDNSIQTQEKMYDLPTTSTESFNYTTRPTRKRSIVSYAEDDLSKVNVSKKRKKLKKNKPAKQSNKTSTSEDISHELSVPNEPGNEMTLENLKTSLEPNKLINTSTSRNISHELPVPNELANEMTLENLKTSLETHNLSENALADIFGIVTKLNEKHAREMKYAKEREWCKVCHKLATIHCCLGTSYCSIECKTIDWEYDHRIESTTHRKENPN